MDRCSSRMFQGGKLKALSVVEPWGDMIASGKKSLEVRSWHPNEIPMKNIALVQNSIRLTKDGQEDPAGKIVAIIDIDGCKPWVKSDSEPAGCVESEFVEGYLAWEVANVRKLNKPIDVVAKRKFYELSEFEIAALRKEFETQ